MQAGPMTHEQVQRGGDEDGCCHAASRLLYVMLQVHMEAETVRVL